MNKSKGIIFLKVAVALLALYLLYFFLMASAPIIAFILILVLFLLPAVGFFLVSRKKAEIDLLKIQHDEIMQQIEYRKTEFDHLCTAQKDEMDNKNKDLIIEVTAKEEQLKDLTAKVNELKHEKETLENELNNDDVLGALNKYRTKLMEEINALEEKNQQLKNDNKHNNELLHDQQQNLNTLMNETRSLENQIKQKKNELGILSEPDNSEYITQLREANKTSMELELDNLRSEIVFRQQELNTLRKEVDSKQQESDSLQQKIDTNQQELETLKKQIKRVKAKQKSIDEDY